MFQQGLKGFKSNAGAGYPYYDLVGLEVWCRLFPFYTCDEVEIVVILVFESMWCNDAWILWRNKDSSCFRF